MTDKVPFTIEILRLDHDCPVVVDRVIGGSVHFEEAKRIGQRLLSIADPGTRSLSQTGPVLISIPRFARAADGMKPDACVSELA